MIDLFGSRKPIGNSLARREFLEIGCTGTRGLGLSDWMSLREAKAAPQGKGHHFGRAKSSILLYLYGAHPQHETFDPKPDAPAEVQGELKPISTSVPGVSFGEGLPNTSRIMDRVTVVRSMTHQFPLHCFAYAVTAVPGVSRWFRVCRIDRNLSCAALGQAWPFQAIYRMVIRILPTSTMRVCLSEHPSMDVDDGICEQAFVLDADLLRGVVFEHA